MVKPWPEISEQSLLSTPVFEIDRRRVVSPRTDQERDMYVIGCPDWVNVIALDSQDNVVMVRQYRHGTRSETLEIPGGVLESGETPEAGAGRELREETGYAAQRVEHLGFVEPNPAIQRNACHLCVAHGLTPGEPALDPGEDIDVCLVPLSEIPARIQSGQITHALVVSAFYFFANRGRTSST